jgi:Gas vesicle synthesis protein GvpL/GvpF
VPLHVYGVTRAGVALPEDLAGRSGGTPRAVVDGSLQAVVCDVGDDARARREDLLNHAHVLERIVADSTVLPVQFGMLMPNDDTVRQDLLSQDRDSLERLLSAFDGLVQVSVTATHIEDAALREVLRRDPELAAMRDAVRGKASQDAEQLRLGEAVARALEALAADDGARIVERLAPVVRAVAEQDPRGLQVANIALLVERAARDDLDAAVTLVREELSSRVNLRYVGPQPPYAFLEPASAGELAWA